MRPLADLRVVAVEQYGAGPFGTMQLADLGADVIKIEDPSVGGDVSRYIPPFQTGESSLFFESFNRGKRSVSLDLRQPEARRVFEDIVAASDVVFSNLRGDQPERLRLRYRDLAHVNKQVVCVSLSGFGQSGPRRSQGAYDATMQGFAGWMSLTGEPEGPPAKTGLSVVDFCGGYVAAIAILAGVLAARRDGEGCDADLSLFEVALAQLTYVGTWVASQGFAPRRRTYSAHPSIVPFQLFPTADGWLVIACPKQSLWVRLCEAIGAAGLLSDHRFATFADRDQNRDALVPLLADRFGARATDEWLPLLERLGIPCAPVNDVRDALADEQVAHRGGVLGFEHPDLGLVKQVASPLRFTNDDRRAERGPFRGEHTAMVLQTLCGYRKEKVAGLKARGAFGPHRSEAVR